MFKDVFKNTLVLAIICLVSALTLASINSVTSPIIEKLKKQNLEQALLKVSKGKRILEKIEVNDKVVNYYYKIEGGGYLLSLNANGYGGPMSILASYDKDYNLVSSKLMENGETPGLGKKAENPSYMDMYLGNVIPTSKSMLSDEKAASVSGASITFTGIAKALAKGQKYIKGINND